MLGVRGQLCLLLVVSALAGGANGATQGECGQQRSPNRRRRVVQGRIVHEIETWPWQAQSSAIVSVLTAAHCFLGVTESMKIAFSANTAGLDEMPSFSDGEASLGNETRSTPVTIPIKNYQLMFDYNNRSLDNDLAVVELTRPIPEAMPICLTEWDEKIAKNSKDTYIVGGGDLYERMPGVAEVLRQKEVIIYDSDYCHNYNVAGVNLTNYLCADAREKELVGNSCHGDSGGPLLTRDPSDGRFYQLGVTSHGRDCGQTGFPSLIF